MKRSAPAVARNRAAILAVLRRALPERGTVLEVASGTGEHALYFAEHLPTLVFQPSDPDAAACASIEAWRVESASENMRPPLKLDATNSDWRAPEGIDAVININMIHIAPWAACLGLLEHSARLLAPGAPLVMYGPYRRENVVTAPSNVAFDDSLRARDPAWGVRLLEDVVAAADRCGLSLVEVVEMPANNLTAIYRRR